MAVTYSPTLRLILPATGTESGQWGNLTNTNLAALLEQAIAGQQNIPLSNSATAYALTSLDGQVDQARSMGLAFTGALTVNKPITIPNVPKMYVVFNKTTGGPTTSLIITPQGGSVTASVLQGESDIIWCDGSGAAYSMFQKALDGYLPLSGGTVTPLTTTSVPLTIKGIVGQTADYQRWTNSSNVVLMSLSSAGNLSLSGAFSASTIQTTGNIQSNASITAASMATSGGMQIGTDLRVLDEVYFGGGTYRAYTDATFDYLWYSSTAYWAYNKSTLDLYWTGAGGNYVQFYQNGNVKATGNVIAEDVTFGGTNTFDGTTWNTNVAVAAPGGYSITSFFTHRPSTYAAAAWLIGSAAFQLRDSGIGFAPVGWQVSSDRRLKESVRPIHSALLRLSGLDGVTFTRRDFPLRDGEPVPRAGVIAQDVYSVLPEAVTILDEPPEGDPDGPGTMTVDPLALIGLLIEATKALHREIADLHERLGDSNAPAS